MECSFARMEPWGIKKDKVEFVYTACYVSFLWTRHTSAKNTKQLADLSQVWIEGERDLTAPCEFFQGFNSIDVGSDFVFIDIIPDLALILLRYFTHGDFGRKPPLVVMKSSQVQTSEKRGDARASKPMTHQM